jgi:RNA polymerase sigma factor (sigma-70 family)
LEDKLKDNAKCFLLVNGEHIEVTYAELKRRREAELGFAERRFLLLHGMLLEVPEGFYQSFQREVRRERYLQREVMLSLSVANDCGMPYDSIIADAGIDVADLIARQETAEQLRDALAELPDADFALIQALYFDGVTEARYAAKIGVTKQAVNQRKKRILARLKNFFAEGR